MFTKKHEIDNGQSHKLANLWPIFMFTNDPRPVLIQEMQKHPEHILRETGNLHALVTQVIQLNQSQQIFKLTLDVTPFFNNPEISLETPDIQVMWRKYRKSCNMPFCANQDVGKDDRSVSAGTVDSDEKDEAKKKPAWTTGTYGRYVSCILVKPPRFQHLIRSTFPHSLCTQQLCNEARQ